MPEKVVLQTGRRLPFKLREVKITHTLTSPRISSFVKNAMLVSFVGCALAACGVGQAMDDFRVKNAAITRYEPKSFIMGTPGYKEKKLEEDSYRVTVEATEVTPLDRVKNIGLLRSAILAKESGFRYFAIMSAENKVKCTYANRILAYGQPTVILVAKFSNEKDTSHENSYEVNTAVSELRKNLKDIELDFEQRKTLSYAYQRQCRVVI